MPIGSRRYRNENVYESLCKFKKNAHVIEN